MIVLDIETVPTADAFSAPYPEADRQPPANYKTEEAIAKWRDADTAKWMQERAKECSINPRLGRVLCVGTINLRLGTDVDVRMAQTEADEAVVLTRTFDRLAAADGRVITWNGSWDLHFLITRALILGIDPAIDPAVVRDWFRRYTYAPHFDVKAVLTQWAPPARGEGLNEWADALGVAGKTAGMTGASVFPLYREGRLEEIAQYCAQDVATTYALYQRVSAIYGPRRSVTLEPSGLAIVEEPMPWEGAA